MRLQKLRLEPFAGFGRKEIRFGPGLNVVLGSNDVGKSSVFRAIDAALFLPVKIAKSTKEGRDLLPRVLPIGGDHARAVLEFQVRGELVRLEKTWGEGQAVSLEAVNGPKLLQEDRVEAQLRSFLPVPQATFQSVLFMGQGALEDTVSALQDRREALHSFGDMLRLAVDQTAGVSVERLKAKLASQVEAAFQHWDLSTNLPEKGKGIEQRWQKGVGFVLAAYYAREDLKRQARLAREIEDQLGRKFADLNARQASREAAREFVRANEKFVDSVSERQALEARIAKARAESEAMAKDLSAWLQAESDRRNFQPEVTRLEAEKSKLDEELKGALAQGKTRETLSRFERARVARASWEEEKKKLQEILPLKAEDLRRLRAAFQLVDQLKNSMKAGKLQLRFEVRQDLEVSVRKDFDPERKGRMVPGKGMTINAGGRIQLVSDLFELQVTSGELSAGEIEEQLRQANEALANLQIEFKVQSLDEAQERHDAFLRAQQAARGAESLANSFLAAGESFTDLERLVASQAQAPKVREPELVQAELQLRLRELGAKKEGLIRAESLLRDLERRHGVAESALLMQKMLESKSELTALEKNLAALPQLPNTVGPLEDFLQRFRRANLEVGTLGEDVRALAVEVAELKAKLPEQSAQDLERSCLEAEAVFQREFSRGRALLRVQTAILALEGRDGDLYEGFKRDFEGKIAHLSAGKYAQVGMQDSPLPAHVQRKDGTAVPYSWLSAGTKDAFALALRLAMAVHYLGKADGFLLIDDPLVNMDPERQKIAATMIREFAEKHQVVLFTCHPSHAELLGGERIHLESAATEA